MLCKKHTCTCICVLLTISGFCLPRDGLLGASVGVAVLVVGVPSCLDPDVPKNCKCTMYYDLC